MVSALWALVLVASPAPGVYFHLENEVLWRAEVLPGAPSGQSGFVPARVRTHAPVRLPGAVAGFEAQGPRAVAVVCPPGLPRTDALPGCPLALVREDGSVAPLGVAGLWGVPLPDGRLLWLGADLVLRARPLEGGAAAVLATGVLDPHPDPDFRQVGVAHVPGLEAPTPGFDACPAAVDVARGGVRRLAGPCAAAAPFLAPGGAALHVSTASGLASLWSGGRRLSGASSADFVPVPGRELAWLDGARAVYAARYEGDALWLLDVERGVARALGPGHAPARVRDGAGAEGLFAFDGRGVVEASVEGLR